MNMYVTLAVAILAEVVATASLKASEGFTKLLPSVIVVAGYGLAFYFLSLTLRTMPVGIAYAIWAGLGVALVSLIGVVGGVLVINVFSRTAGH
ncbi:MAG: QacE family quaternary ammonium compound efflux SMR transporter [Rhizobiales bacterium]|nr:QacE family quaternary ammonium compound efflux SMR transporter [Hyphomicrobiales bacterium]